MVAHEETTFFLVGRNKVVVDGEGKTETGEGKERNGKGVRKV